MESTALNIDFSSVLEILSKDIYDSPLSLLRENVQNAYDAILMRKLEDPNFTEGKIIITIDGKDLVIQDNGIGMSYENLKENYWSAGCSGKNNDRARAAGVVGTFGIGAMANFGVCSALDVITRKMGGDTPIIHSWVEKKNLSIKDKCVGYEELSVSVLNEFGTIVRGTLDSEHNIAEAAAIAYLKPYVRYVEFPIYLNDILISCEKYWSVNEILTTRVDKQDYYQDQRLKFHYHIVINRNNNQKVCPQILIYDIIDYGNPIGGNLWLSSEAPSIYGYRNSFGLAPIPVDSVFQFGGVANLINLKPTAGRDAVSRESIQFVQKLLECAVNLTAQALCDSDMADSCREFLNYVRLFNRIDLAGKITIGIPNVPNKYELCEIEPKIGEKDVLYYQGNDKTIIDNFTDPNIVLLVPSADGVRRFIQVQWLRRHGIMEVPDKVMITNEVKNDTDLSLDEYSLKFKIERILEDDYLMPQTKVMFADISHGLTVVVQYESDKLKIYLKRGAEEISYLTDKHASDYSLFEPLTKEYVRTMLYPKFADFLPSSKKMGAEALYKMLQQKREIYTIESDDQGEMDNLLEDYLNGKIQMKDVFKAAQKARSSQEQVVSARNIGSVNDVLGSISLNTTQQNVQTVQKTEDYFMPLPPIVVNKETKYKVLRTDYSCQNLHGYQSFLAVSDKMFKENKDFFLAPHSTRIIWSTHKIIYIFTHLSGGITLYYDIDLEQPLVDYSTGGKAIATSTIITDNMIYIPIISEMDHYFDVTGRQLRFYVHYDTIRNA